MLNRNRTGLLVVDIQGKLARLVHQSDLLLSNCGKLIQGAQALGLPIVALEQNPEKLGVTVPEISLLFDHFEALPKFTFGACASSDFVDAIVSIDVDAWLVCGIEAHICVYQTVAGLIERGYQVQIVGDCVSSRDVANRELGIARAKSLGAEITGLEMCLYELVQDCRDPEFRQILALVR